jgi:hypothetical protein
MTAMAPDIDRQPSRATGSPFPDPPRGTEPVGIDGWLLYFGVTLPLGIPARLYVIAAYAGLFGATAAATPATLAPLAGMQVVLLGLSVAATVLFFTRSRLAPTGIVVERTATVLSSLAIASLRPPASVFASVVTWAGLAIGLVALGITIVYLRRSVRVRNTFTR